MEFQILGPLEVLDGDRVVSLPRGRGRALLALLLVHAAQIVGTERLINELWGDVPPPTVRTALQGLVSRLRKSLAPAHAGGGAPMVLRTEPAGYVLDVDPVSIDAHRFRRLLERAQELPAADKASLLREALALWRGAALADFTYEPFAQQEAATLEELRLVAVEERIDADLVMGRHGPLVAELEALVAEHPFRERLRGQLMLALYRSGRQSEALEAYRTARQTLVDDLGVEPNPQLRRLEQAILRQDASLVAESVRETGQQPWLPRHRRVVTAVSVPVVAAPDAAVALDPELLERLSERAREAGAAAITRHGGTVAQTTGDELCGLFGIHTAHEDDTLRAARAGVDVRDALMALNEKVEPRLSVRVGIETGEVVVGLTAAELLSVSGGVASSAARLQRTAPEGDVLVGATARRLLRDAVVFEPLTRSASTPLTWRLAGLVPGAPAVPRRFDTPLVGRTAELARVREAFERAVQEGTGHRLTVLGEPGIGKSRLARELVTTVGPGARTLTGHCPAYGEGMAFRPLREVVLQAVGRRGPDALAELLGRADDGAWIAAQVAGAVGLAGEIGRPDELFPAIRRLFEALADSGPVIVILEDMHWAQPTMLDLVEYLEERTRGAVLFLCLARPELLEERPSWGQGAGVMAIGALGRDEADRLATNRPHGRVLPVKALQQVVETAQGNPLFVEQLVATYEDEGTVVAVPASIHALLASRLDRLGPGERDVLRCASVVGADIAVGALLALVPAAAAPFVQQHLGSLERKQLIRSAQDRLHFRHALIRHAAYRSMTRGDRARLHERYAEWLRAEPPRPQSERAGVIGYHLEQATVERRAAGIEDGHTAALATRAGEHLADAGVQAFTGIRDMAAAANLMSRAKSLLPALHPRRQEVMDVLADAYPPLGRHDRTAAVLAEMLDDALTGGNRPRELVIRLRQARIRLDTDVEDVAVIRAEAERAVEEFAAAGDDAGVAQAAYLLAQVHRMVGATRQVAEVARTGLPHADRSGLVRAEIGLRYALSWATQAGETRVPEAITRCERLAWRNGVLHPPVLCDVAVLRAMRGEPDAGRDLVAGVREHLVERMRVRRPLMFVARYAGEVEMLAGDLVAAERELRMTLQLALDMGEQDFLAQTAAELSHVLTVRGDAPEASRLASLAADHAPAASVARVRWRTAKARVLVRAGKPAEAEPLAREAVDLAPEEMPNLRGDALVELAHVLRAGGWQDAAAPVLGEAIERYEAKSNLASAARTRALRRP